MVEMSITNYLISFGNFSNADYVRRLNEQVSSTVQQVKSEISTSTVSFFKAPNFLLKLFREQSVCAGDEQLHSLLLPWRGARKEEFQEGTEKEEEEEESEEPFFEKQQLS